MKSMLKLLNPSAGAVLRKISYPKGHLLLHPGDISDKIWWVEEGFLREFFAPEKGRDITTQIVAAGTFIYSPLSYLSGEPADKFIEVVEKCRVIPLTRNSVTPHFLRAVLEQTILRTEKRFKILQLKRPDQRLEAFEQLYPELCNQIPLYCVASLLNITPQTLSRIRSSRASRGRPARHGPLPRDGLSRADLLMNALPRFCISATRPVKVNFHPNYPQGFITLLYLCTFIFIFYIHEKDLPSAPVSPVPGRLF